MKRKLISVFMLALSLITGCQSPLPSSKSISQLHFEGGKLEFENIGMISKVLSQNVYNDHLFLSDLENSRILKVTTSFVGESEIGSTGDGPGEFHGVDHFTIVDDKVYAYSYSNHKMNIFDVSGKFIEQIPVLDPIIGRFSVQDKKITFSNYESVDPLHVYATDGIKLKSFGTQLAGENELQRRMRSIRHVFSFTKDSEHLRVAVSKSEPYIELYDASERLIRSHKIQGIPFVEERMKHAESEYAKSKNHKIIMLLFQDAYLSGDSLFLLLFSSEPPHHVLRYKIEGHDFSLQRIYRIDEPSYLLSMSVYNQGEAFYFYDLDMGGMRMYSEVAQ